MANRHINRATATPAIVALSGNFSETGQLHDVKSLLDVLLPADFQTLEVKKASLQIIAAGVTWFALTPFLAILQAGESIGTAESNSVNTDAAIDSACSGDVEIIKFPTKLASHFNSSAITAGDFQVQIRHDITAWIRKYLKKYYNTPVLDDQIPELDVGFNVNAPDNGNTIGIQSILVLDYEIRGTKRSF
jgi:hypothetical protein